MRRLRGKLTYANVVSTLCLFLLLSGGAAYAASHLGKNAVGSKQLKKNAITTTKIKNQAVTAAKIKNGAITGQQIANGSVSGTQINASTLGTVPTAQKANTLAPPEAVHLVGANGEPPFENGAFNYSPNFMPGGFFKDRECVVHLQGTIANSNNNSIAFTLPAADRPPKDLLATIAGNPPATGTVHVDPDGAVRLGLPDPSQGLFGLDGVSFRAATC